MSTRPGSQDSTFSTSVTLYEDTVAEPRPPQDVAAERVESDPGRINVICMLGPAEVAQIHEGSQVHSEVDSGFSSSSRWLRPRQWLQPRVLEISSRGPWENRIRIPPSGTLPDDQEFFVGLFRLSLPSASDGSRYMDETQTEAVMAAQKLCSDSLTSEQGSNVLSDIVSKLNVPAVTSAHEALASAFPNRLCPCFSGRLLRPEEQHQVDASKTVASALETALVPLYVGHVLWTTLEAAVQNALSIGQDLASSRSAQHSFNVSLLRIQKQDEYVARGEQDFRLLCVEAQNPELRMDPELAGRIVRSHRASVSLAPSETSRVSLQRVLDRLQGKNKKAGQSCSCNEGTQDSVALPRLSTSELELGHD